MRKYKILWSEKCCTLYMQELQTLLHQQEQWTHKKTLYVAVIEVCICLLLSISKLKALDVLVFTTTKQNKNRWIPIVVTKNFVDGFVQYNTTITILNIRLGCIPFSSEGYNNTSLLLLSLQKQGEIKNVITVLKDMLSWNCCILISINQSNSVDKHFHGLKKNPQHTIWYFVGSRYIPRLQYIFVSQSNCGSN